MGLRPLECRDRGFESRLGHGYLSVLLVVEVAAYVTG
jgi:hypothetical protein